MIVESLPDRDRATGRRLNEDLEPLCIREGFKLQFECVTSRDALFDLLVRLGDRCRQEGWMPLLHLEMHGREDKAGLVLSNGDFVSWRELIQHLRAINRACANNLTVVLPVCWGIHVQDEVFRASGVSKATPFVALIAPGRKVWPDEIETATRRFYEIALSTGGGDLNAALEAMNAAVERVKSFDQPSNPYNLYLSPRLFVAGVLQYLWKYCRGQENRARLEAFDIPMYARRFLLSDDPGNVGRFKIAEDEILREFREAESRADKQPERQMRLVSRPIVDRGPAKP